MSKQYDVYLASPLFCEYDNKILDIVEGICQKLGLTYFSPRHDSKIDLRSAKTPAEKDALAQKIFELNDHAVSNSTLILTHVIGTRWNNAIYCDAGTMVEAGLAFAKNIPVLTYNFEKYGLNIMLSQKVVYHCDNTTFEDYSELEKSLFNAFKLIKDENITDPANLRTALFQVKDRDLY
ncbi:mannosyltransferase [Yersinia phage vB_Yru_GN1]|uniref:Mannosyltransferase n=1 Tax=Yersinia phage vB_Yru_GN1 TaxID=3074381 RepID=A0AA86IYZ0_9CAUD|nr:mannosyltransferase [Yersinia phage vB_Yru_GN1]